MSKSNKSFSDAFDGIDMSKFRGGTEPALIRAARAFQDNIRVRDSRIKQTAEKNNNLEKELSDLQIKMDSKMNELQDLQDLAEKTKPAAHILETVMGELEQRNLELSSLLQASERSRSEMESMLKEQNEDLTTLRANTVIMRTLEEEITSMNERKNEMLDQMKMMEEELSECKQNEQNFNHRLSEMDTEREQASQDFSERIQDLSSKLQYADDQSRDKDHMIEKTEVTVKELFEKCNQLGTNNSEIKSELLHCLESGKKLRDLNTKLQFCKDYLEQQVDQLIRELKASKGTNEQFKLEMSNINREKQNCNKQIMLLEEQQKQSTSEISILKDKLSNLQKHLQEYENGDIRSASCISEINREKEAHENTRLALEKKVREMESELKHQDGDLKNNEMCNRKLKTEMVQANAKIEYYQQNFIEKQELQKIRSDLEIKYKLDLNTQLQKVSAMFEQEQNELISTMRQSLNQRQEVQHSEYDSPLHRMAYRTHN